MQFFQKMSLVLSMVAICGLVIPATQVAYAAQAKTSAKAKKTYSEEEFLKVFSGKSRKVVSELLGSPNKKEQSVKPTGANTMVATMGAKSEDKSNPVNVEMWYYSGVVRYDAKHTYGKTELTFVNDRCMNITFFNTK